MMTFNLIDEPWIPVVGRKRVSLKQVFSDETISGLAGTPLEKIAVLKLLQAISQASDTPVDTQEWRKRGADLLAFGKTCNAYLEKNHEAFDLYGDKPFLQVKAVTEAKKCPIGALYPHIASGNNTVWRSEQIPESLDDGEKALLLLVQMSCGFAGKRPDSKFSIKKGLVKKSAHAGPAIERLGALHSFCLGKSLLETVWLNTFTQEEIETKMPECPQGLGVPPWERMPLSEEDDVACRLKETLMGRLVPLCRFCLIVGNEMHLTEGIVHPGSKEFCYDPSMLVTREATSKGDNLKLTWSDPEKSPWRELTAICSFLASQRNTQSECQQVNFCWTKLRGMFPELTVWSGGVQVTSTMGEQKVSGANDYVESETTFPPLQDWFNRFGNEMRLIDSELNYLDLSINHYAEKMESSDSDARKKKAKRLFWQQCERVRQRIVDDCTNREKREALRRTISRLLLESFDEVCPNETARQLDAWAYSRPSFRKYISGLSQKENPCV